jgi:hypothetical protein
MALLETYVSTAFWLAKRVRIIVVEGRVLVRGKRTSTPCSILAGVKEVTIMAWKQLGDRMTT